MKGLLPLLAKTEQFEELIGDLREPRAEAAAIVPDPATAYLVATAWHEFGAPVFVLTPSPESARRLTDQLVTWLGEDAPVFQFVETENIPFERYIPDLGSTHQRLRSMAALVDNDSPRPALVVSSIQAAAQATIERQAFDRSRHVVRVGDRFNLNELVRRWTRMGYEVEATVEVPGSASRRGGILDLFPVSSDLPARIEFFDDEVESIRLFDPGTQRSLDRTDSVTITPALESLPDLADIDRASALVRGMDLTGASEDAQTRIPSELNRAFNGELPDEISFYAGFFNFGTIFDYLPPESLTMLLRPSAVEESSRNVDKRMAQLRRAKESRGDVPPHFPQPHIEWGFIADAINNRQRRLTLSPWGVDSDLPGGALRLPFEPAPITATSAERSMELIAKRSHERSRIVVMSNHSRRLHEMSQETGLSAVLADAVTDTPEPGDVFLAQGHLRDGFALATRDFYPLVLLTDNEVFGIQKERRRVRRRPVRHGPALEQLKPGTYVVHVEHGIGRFAGTTVLGDDGREFLVLEYAEDDKLYVPTEHLDRIQFYHGSGDTQPRLTRLGTQEWSRAKARAKRATEQLAGELIALYAAREVAEGASTGPDTPWQDSLEASFPYEETDDQLTTLAAVKSDLESTRPMDRLVCGDVGYGKTEIALRAAFKVVQSGRQAAILVPTTVLAQQHFTTFSERLQPFPAKVEMLSRFRSDAEQKSVIKGLDSGEVDILIGTHRMLQKDVRFKNLGLVIIDEEHKFGVTHKERLKRLRTQVDVLTLSATPIPRTLHMSLAGVRDMSTIETPPEERLPIKTYVSEESDELVREAILRELDRGGQVFFLHNRVKNIEHIASKLQELVPEAEIRIGHGQMAEDELEDVMAEFTARRFDVLVCTTIIESGIDLPNANTLIVNRADMFGLSQLYQLRGRIGRGTNRAYAYMIVPRGKQLTEAAEQRLNTILAATELGAGFQIAMRDLEIRGMGNILGAEQSGQIAAVGFDLYTKILAETVEALKKGADKKNGRHESTPDFSTVRVDLGVDARIPDSYIEDLAQRLSIYQRLAWIHSLEELSDLREELWDRFGPVPKHVDLLIHTAKVRILAEETNVDSVMTTENRATLSLREPTGGARGPLQKMLGRGVSVGHMQIRVDIDRDEDDWLEELAAVLEQIQTFRERMLAMMQSTEAAGD
ncbi:MAG: transcription-repair coupling factor [Dehalococcoidia bacterium]